MTLILIQIKKLVLKSYLFYHKNHKFFKEKRKLKKELRKNDITEEEKSHLKLYNFSHQHSSGNAFPETMLSDSQ